MHFLGELVDRGKKRGAQRKKFGILRGKRLVLQKTVKSRDDARSNMVNPNPQAGSFEWFSGEQTWPVRWICIFEELANNGTLIECLALIFQSGN